jgi:subtilisin family serine protease
LRGRVRLARNLVTEHPTARGGEIHGTAIAGIIASAVNNREGIIGVAPDVSIAALRACWAVGEDALAAQCSSFSLARALEVALGLQPNVINLSLAGPDDPLLSRLLDQADRARHRRRHRIPGNVRELIRLPVVAPARADGALLDGPREFRLAVHAGRPATEVLTTTPGAGYAFLSGNSLAAAHTTGVIALLMERQPDIDAERNRRDLTATTTYSSGNASINACRAGRAACRLTEACQEPPPSVRF